MPPMVRVCQVNKGAKKYLLRFILSHPVTMHTGKCNPALLRVCEFSNCLGILSIALSFVFSLKSSSEFSIVLLE